MPETDQPWKGIPRPGSLELDEAESDDRWDMAFCAKLTIRRNLEPDDVILQLAEEAAELAQAAAKYIRARRSKNPTPVSAYVAHKQLCEELADVLNCAYVLGLDEDSVLHNRDALPKLRRWADRLKNGCCER